MDGEDTLTALFHDLGIDLADENFAHTPRRWLKYLEHYLQPYNPERDLSITFPLKGGSPHGAPDLKFQRSMVVQTGIPFAACCAHHLLPVLGIAHVAYIPRDRAVGLSKLSRLVYGVSHQSPSLQEDVCNEITDHLMKYLNPLGAACLVSAEHGCMTARGVEQGGNGVKTVTTSLKGVFIDDYQVRQEFYEMVKQG